MNTCPYDIIFHIFSYLDRNSLLACSLVNHVLKDIAKPNLFRSIEIWHVNEGDNDFSVLQQLNQYPYLRSYVREVHHYGPRMISHSGSTDLTPLWAVSLAKLENLVSYTIRTTYQATLSTTFVASIMQALVKCRLLQQINLDFFVYSYHVPALTLLSNLRTISLGRPSRTALALIGTWVHTFKQPLERLYIKAGIKVEPETITQFQQHFYHLNYFTLGRDHRLSGNDLLQLSAAMPNLRGLDVFYDHFTVNMNDAPVVKTDSQLVELTVRHQGVSSSHNFCTFFTWLRVLAVDSGPHLKYLSIVSDDERRCQNPSTFFTVFDARTSLRNLKALIIPHIRLKKEHLPHILAWKFLEVLDFYLEDNQALEFCVGLKSARELGPNLQALRWLTSMQEKTVMFKVNLLVSTLGRESGEFRKIGVEQFQSEWRGSWNVTGKEEILEDL